MYQRGMGLDNAISYRLSEADAVSAGRFAAARQLILRPIFRILLIVVAVLYVLLLMLDWRAAVQPLLTGLILALAAALLLATFVLIPMQTKRHYRQAPGLRDEIGLRWDGQGLEFTTTRGQSRLAWSDYHRWGENGRLLLLFQSEILYNIVPKSELSEEQLDDIRSRFTAAGVRRI